MTIINGFDIWDISKVDVVPWFENLPPGIIPAMCLRLYEEQEAGGIPLRWKPGWLSEVSTSTEVKPLIGKLPEGFQEACNIILQESQSGR